jgi:hypothetical protein
LSAVYKYDLCPSQSCSTVAEEEIAPLLDWRRSRHREGESLEETSGDWRVAGTSVELDQCIISVLFFEPSKEAILHMYGAIYDQVPVQSQLLDRRSRLTREGLSHHEEK